jgi:hypothetical protein
MLLHVITLQNKKTLFYVFWYFKDLSELKLTEDFYIVNILSQKASRDQEVNEEVHEAQIGTCGVGP